MDKLVEQFLKLYEKKDHIIKKLSNLTDNEKEILIDLFNKKPHLENKIDWNNKDLVIEDFNEVLNFVSKTEASKSKSGIISSNFIEGKDFFDITGNDNFKAIIPLNYEFQKFIQNKGYDGKESKWCIGQNGDDKYWYQYNYLSYFIILVNSEAKVAVQVTGNNLRFWNAEDNKKESYQWIDSTESERNLVKEFEKVQDNYLEQGFNLCNEQVQNNPLTFIDNFDGTCSVSLNNSFGILRESIKSIEIPSVSPDNIPVTIIVTDGFERCRELRQVTISEGILEIERSAFTGCIDLPSIELPKSLTAIDNLAFWNCNKLKYINIPDNITRIGEGAFNMCPNLRSVYSNRTKKSIKDITENNNDELFTAEWKKLSLVESFLTNYL